MSKRERERVQRYSGGPGPRTERGRRRHAWRSESQRNHAQLVWAGGYVIGQVREVTRVLPTGGGAR
jgi:hypothetical protein